MLTAETLDHQPGLRHGFFSRQGGVSEGLFASLNCGLGSGDTPEAVRENRARALRQLELPDAPLVTCFQVHSPTAVTVTEPWPEAARPRADALVTDRRGVALGVVTADCAPVLFADARAGVVGAAHAGWKGALAGVVGSTVAAMEALGAKRERVAAAVGPCIGWNSYEVGPEFPLPFLAQAAGNARFFKPGQGDRQLFDLKAYVAWRLAEAGVGTLAVEPADTWAEESRFFSYRRSTQRREPDYGRLLSAIALEP